MLRKLSHATSRILDQSQEINFNELLIWPKFLSAFPALRHRNYQLYFSGQLVSLTGTWLQQVALAWLVLQLTNSAFMVGLVAALGTLPVLIFSLIGGVIVDRFSKKKILLFSQFFSMVFAFILGFLTIFNFINVWQIIVLSFISGIINALDMPARQSFVIEMVGKEDLTSAIALNSGIFNAARVVGPAIAGLIIALYGTGTAFLLNGLTYIAVIFALYLIHEKSQLPQIHPHPIDSIKEGLLYSFSHNQIKILLIFVAVVSIFGWSYATILPVVTQKVFQQGAAHLGYLYTATGMGALTGTILVSIFSKKKNAISFIIKGNIIFAISIVVFSFITKFSYSLPFLFLAGMGLIMQLATVNSTIQHLVDNNIRGRVMSLYTLMFVGMMPLGSFQVGLIADRFGPQLAIRIGGIVVLLLGIILYLNKHRFEN